MVVEITTVFLDTIQDLFGGIADGIVNLFTTMIYPVTDNGVDGILGTADDIHSLSTLGTWMLIFMGFSFAITIFYALFKKIA